MTELLPVKQERNLGIDLLRMFSMLLVVVLHVLGQGGVLSATKLSSATNYNFAWLLEVAAYCAVNCYALISGYVGVKAKFKYTNIVMLWLQVVIYTGLITLLFSIFHSDMMQEFYTKQIQSSYPTLVDTAAGTEHIWSALFPVLKNEYWYFTSYFCMFFFIPFFNYVVNHMPRKQLRVLIISLFVVFSLIPAVSRAGIIGIPASDIFYTDGGYNAVWLSIVYIIGAYISKYNVLEKLPAGYCFILYVLAVLISWIAKLYISGGGVLVNYTSPTILIAGVALLLGFSKLKLKPRPVRFAIRFLSPLSFSVYLIHVHPLVWQQYMLRRYVDFAYFPTWKMILAVLAATFGIYLFCSAVDLIRHYLFRLLHLRQGLDALEKKICGKLWEER